MAPSAAITVLLSRLYRLPSALPWPIISVGTVFTEIFTSLAEERLHVRPCRLQVHPADGRAGFAHVGTSRVLRGQGGADSTGKVLITKEP